MHAAQWWSRGVKNLSSKATYLRRCLPPRRRFAVAKRGTSLTTVVTRLWFIALATAFCFSRQSCSADASFLCGISLAISLPSSSKNCFGSNRAVIAVDGQYYTFCSQRTLNQNATGIDQFLEWRQSLPTTDVGDGERVQVRDQQSEFVQCLGCGISSSFAVSVPTPHRS